MSDATIRALERAAEQGGTPEAQALRVAWARAGRPVDAVSIVRGLGSLRGSAGRLMVTAERPTPDYSIIRITYRTVTEWLSFDRTTPRDTWLEAGRHFVAAMDLLDVEGAAGGSTCPARVGGDRCRRSASNRHICLCTSRWADHGTVLRSRSRGGPIFISQPYGPPERIEPELVNLRTWAGARGVTVEVSDAMSWCYPGRTSLITVRR